MLVKTCLVCKKALSLDAFGKNVAAKDGYRASCKTCEAIRRSLKPPVIWSEGDRPTEQTCRKCGLTKPIDAFYPDASRKSGHRGLCRACDAAQHLSRNPHKIRPPWICPTEKACRTCGLTKPLDAFYQDQSKKDGHNGVCKVCDDARNLLRRPRKVRPTWVCPTEKACRKCGVVKALVEFYQNKRFRDGRQTLCIDCDKARKQTEEVRAQAKNYNESEKGKATYRRYVEKGRKHEVTRAYQQQPEIAAKIKERHPVYAARYAKSPKGKATIKAWRNGPKRKAWTEEWMSRPGVRERLNAIAIRAEKRKKAKKQGLPSTFTPDDWKIALDYFGHACAYCGEIRPLAQEHFIPLSANGPYTPDNIVPACKSCNSRKYNKLPEDWCDPDVYDRIACFLISRMTD